MLRVWLRYAAGKELARSGLIALQRAARFLTEMGRFHFGRVVYFIAEAALASLMSRAGSKITAVIEM